MFKQIIIATKRLIGQLPKVNDLVWWAPKQLGCTVTEVRRDGVVIFQGGEIVRNSRGRELPRWTVATAGNNFVWRPDLGMFTVGQGPEPKNVRGTIVKPEPVLLSGKSQGSFAVKG